MTTDDIIKMPIEEIIHLPNFIRLEYIDNTKDFWNENGLLISPYWKITFRGQLMNDGSRNFECFGSKSILPTFVIHKYKDEALNIKLSNQK